MSEILFSYPDPKNNPNCLCPNPGAAFYCSTGHMLECHSGFSCRQARCSHLPRYSDGEMTDYAIENAPAWDVTVKHGARILVSLSVYAPSAVSAIGAVKDWISQTENLSQIQAECSFAAVLKDEDTTKS